MCDKRYWKNIFTFNLSMRDEGIILAAKRSDDIIFSTSILLNPIESFVARMNEGVKKLEEYRICKCSDAVKCNYHRDKPKQHFWKGKKD